MSQNIVMPLKAHYSDEYMNLHKVTKPTHDNITLVAIWFGYPSSWFKPFRAQGLT
jgi:hypothetical protein